MFGSSDTINNIIQDKSYSIWSEVKIKDKKILFL